MKIIYRIPGLVLLLTAVACADELNQQPVTSKELGNFVSNEIEVDEYVNAVYSNLQLTGLYRLYLPAFGEIPSDNTFDEVPANDAGIYGQLDEFTTAPSNDIVSDTWRDSYRAIQKANVVLNRIDPIEFKDQKIKTTRVGEMKFIRALLYFNLVRLYGKVPLVTEETTDPNKYFGQGRTDVSVVYEQIINDLTDAIPDLPESTTQPGRVIRTAAQSLLAKVYLTLHRDADTKELLYAVVNSKRHSLQPKPADVFALASENNAEIIFAVQFASGVNGNTEGTSMFQQFSPSGTQSGAKGHNLPTKELYALYQAGDRRKDSYVKLVPGSGIPYNGKLTKPTTVIDDGANDVVVLRYADVLLMLAEAENNTGNTTVAAGFLNEVRTRAGLSNTTATTTKELENAIELERRLELIGEGHRWFDLLRTGKAISTMNEWFRNHSKNITVDEHHLLMPVPQSQYNTDPTLGQNDGY